MTPVTDASTLGSTSCSSGDSAAAQVPTRERLSARLISHGGDVPTVAVQPSTVGEFVWLGEGGWQVFSVGAGGGG